MPHLLVTLPVEVRQQKREATWTRVKLRGLPHLRCDFELFRSQSADKEGFLNGWAVRDRFLRLRQNDSDLLEFLRWNGLFVAATPSMVLKVSTFWKWQELFREVLLNKTTSRKEEDILVDLVSKLYLKEPMLRVQLFSLREKPRAVVEANCGLEAIGATVELDLLRGAEFKWCARPDCPKKIFEPKSRHQKKYCSYECGHLQSIRNKRGTIVPLEGVF